MAGNPGITHSMLWVAVTQIILYEAQVIALIGQIKAAGMAQHVGINIT
jgi:hypothetical protein